MSKKKKMTYNEAFKIVQDYENGKNVSYSDYNEAMDILW